MSYKKFETELIVRPDDIDMNNHVHNSKYLDYVLFARYDQMGRCYGFPMDKFIEKGWVWYQKSWNIEFKRALNIAERITIRTWLISFEKADVTVGFQILKDNGKLSAEGIFTSTMINATTGRAEAIPDWVIQQYAQHTE
jgi:YbgC/YbaW family acyl-CoA thioester hydrolase